MGCGSVAGGTWRQRLPSKVPRSVHGDTSAVNYLVFIHRPHSQQELFIIVYSGFNPYCWFRPKLVLESGLCPKLMDLFLYKTKYYCVTAFLALGACGVPQTPRNQGAARRWDVRFGGCTQGQLSGVKPSFYCKKRQILVILFFSHYNVVCFK